MLMFFEYSPSPETNLCVPCSDFTLVCDGFEPWESDECRDFAFKWGEDSRICAPWCPTGSTRNTETGECDKSPYDECLTFNLYAIEYTGPVMSMTSGVFPGEPDASDPIAIYRRGLWYDGVSFSEIKNLALNHDFTIEMWVRPSGGITLFSVNRATSAFQGDEDYISYGMKQEQYFLRVVGAGDVELLNMVSPVAYIEREWYLASFTIAWDQATKTSTATLFSMGFEIVSRTFFEPIFDYPVF